MAKVPPPERKGTPPAPEGTLGHLDTPGAEDVRYLSFLVSGAFKKEFSLFTIQHDYANQEPPWRRRSSC